MIYRYEDLKPRLFTETGIDMYIRIRDRTRKLLDEAGAARMGEMIRGGSGDSWLMLACVDRMVEVGELIELTTAEHGWHPAGQHRVFIGVAS